MKTDNVDVGRDALNLFVVAPARFTHDDDCCTDLKPYPCFVMLDAAIDFARELGKASNRRHCVYRLDPLYTTGE